MTGILGKIRNKLVGRPISKFGPEPTLTLSNGGVVVYDQFLPKEDFIALQRWAYSVDCDRSRDDRKWPQYICRDFAESWGSRQWSSKHDDMPEAPRRWVESLHAQKLVDPGVEVHLGVYRWQPNSGMGEHTDGHTKTALTFYLNDTWQDDWFGDFIGYETPEDHRKGIGVAVAPMPNRLVINHDTIMHKVTYCSSTAVERVTLQAFLVDS